MILSDFTWKLKYTPDDGDLVRLFYVPALETAVRYDRSTGYFSASALTLAARGIEGLVRNNGRMRLVVGCTLAQAEIDAIEKGQKLRDAVEQKIGSCPLDPSNKEGNQALELLSWMIAKGFLEVKVAVPCDLDRRPIPSDGIFHEKAGIVEDKAGYRLAWNGSLNETSAGWQHNWESINIFTRSHRQLRDSFAHRAQHFSSQTATRGRFLMIVILCVLTLAWICTELWYVAHATIPWKGRK